MGNLFTKNRRFQINEPEHENPSNEILQHSGNSILCDVLKKVDFLLLDGPKLEEKLKAEYESDKFGKIRKKLYCLLGNGRNEILTILEIVNELLTRNYPELEEFDGTEKLAIFVPEWYLTKAIKYVEPNRGSQLQTQSQEAANLCPERRQYFEDMKNFFAGGQRTYWGELPEKNLYDALQLRFKNNDETVSVFHGIDILKLNLERSFKVCEKDFVIISATHKYIMVIEVKKTLGAGDSVEKSFKQLHEAKADLEAWFGADGLNDWMYIPLIFTEEIDTQLKCDECIKYIIEGNFFAATKIKFFPK